MSATSEFSIAIGALFILMREHEEGRIQLGAWEPKIPASIDWAYTARDPETGFAVVCAHDAIRDCICFRTKNSLGQSIDMRTPDQCGETPERYLQRYIAPLMPFLAQGQTMVGMELAA